MSDFHILHLYPDTMDLYGDYKCISVLCERIREMGHHVDVTRLDLQDSLSFDNFDLVYIGHGKIRNLEAVAHHFVSYHKDIIQHIEDGQVWFVTGNARELFGKSFERSDNTEMDGIGLFPYIGRETKKVFVSDMLARPVYDPNAFCYGFANRTAYLEGDNTSPLFTVLSGFGDSKVPDNKEGTLYKNFFGTWAMGPALIRNPSLMREILKRVCKNDYVEGNYSLEEQALQLVVDEFPSKEEHIK